MGKHTSHTSNGTASSSAPAASGLFHAADTFQGRELVDRLREIGLDKYIELPQIAVMGDTSSGKSSLLSALSGVAFPSSHELTTRCPTQLILSRGPKFTGSARLHRFQATHSELDGPIMSLDDVPLAIERFTKLLVDEGQTISDDEIIIELRGPELPNLTLTDLPGIVRTVGDKEDPSMIPRVRAMVNRYMKQTRTIIMAVVPANVDMHNIEILQNAQEADPSGERTIAVVTKLDLVDHGAERSVEQLLLNRTKRLALGYHAVKCRGQKDLNDGVKVAQGLQQEQAFFKQHPFWCALPYASWGIKELTRKLVDIMQSNIRRTMPLVIKEINDQVAQANDELKGLGSALDSPLARRQAFGTWAERFTAPMQAVLKGDYDALVSSDMVDDDGVDLRLRAQIRLCDEAFKEQIKATESRMPGRSDSADVAPGDYVVVDVDGHEKTFRVDQVRDRGDVLCIAYNADEWLGSSRYKPHELNHLRRFIVKNRGDELPIFPPYTVFCSILRQWVDTWEAPMLELAQQYRKFTLAAASRMASELGATPRVHEYIQERARATIDVLRDRAEDELRKELARERRPYTQNGELIKTYAQLLRPGLEALLKQQLTMDTSGRVNFGQLLTVLTDMSHANDEHDTVLMDCGLRAYFQAAMTRFVDVVPMRLNDMLLREFVDTMRAELQNTTDAKLAKLLNESSATQSRRQELQEKLATLRTAKDEIEEL